MFVVCVDFLAYQSGGFLDFWLVQLLLRSFYIWFLIRVVINLSQKSTRNSNEWNNRALISTVDLTDDAIFERIADKC